LRESLTAIQRVKAAGASFQKQQNTKMCPHGESSPILYAGREPGPRRGESPARLGRCLDSSRYNEYNQNTVRRTVIPEEAAYLALQRTSELLSRRFAELLKSEDLSPAQYNVLRILRGSPEGLTCGEIADRMITRDPDITRLLDRMEKRRLIARARSEKDRRVVLVRLLAEGLAVLAALDRPVRDTHRRLLGHLGPERLREMMELLESCRSGAE
jgi:DNA-binding MarR family transcriptional regulator